MTQFDITETQIAERLRAAKIRLRFDRVVRSLSVTLQTALSGAVPARQSVVFTLTAPIRRPAETSASLESLFRERGAGVDLRRTIHGNHIRMRTMAGVAKHASKVLVLVHNPDADSSQILAIAESCLTAQD
jgi:hypothetical protein